MHDSCHVDLPLAKTGCYICLYMNYTVQIIYDIVLMTFWRCWHMYCLSQSRTNFLFFVLLFMYWFLVIWFICLFCMLFTLLVSVQQRRKGKKKNTGECLKCFLQFMCFLTQLLPEDHKYLWCNSFPGATGAHQRGCEDIPYAHCFQPETPNRFQGAVFHPLPRALESWTVVK